MMTYKGIPKQVPLSICESFKEFFESVFEEPVRLDPF